MAVVSIAIIVSFHLKNQPTELEKKFALPFGLVFWVLSLACLASGLANYVGTVRKYSERRALVQTGWKTQVVSKYFCATVMAFPYLCIEHWSIFIALITYKSGIHHRGNHNCCCMYPLPVHKRWKMKKVHAIFATSFAVIQELP